MTRTGQYQLISTTGEQVRAFVPDPLPPKIQMDSLNKKLETASRSLGKLDGMSSILPNPSIFLYHYIRKEATLSSQIEGTQSSLSDLLQHESEQAPGVPVDDLLEVSSYVRAMRHGLKRIREDNFPISTRLMREIHKILLSSGRGSQKQPGEFRCSQNWIGGTRPGNAVFVPPPTEKVQELMSGLEKFIHTETSIPVLLKAGMVHAQFESIHPFLDGNGRLGRLLISFIFCAQNILSEPLLYLSLWFKTHKSTYYDLLQRVRSHGDWESWLGFFLEGVAETSRQAAETAANILKMFESDRRKIEAGLDARSSLSVLRVHECLQERPVLSVQAAAGRTGLTFPPVNRAFQHLEQLGIVREISGRQRHRLFYYHKYVAILNEGTEVS